MFSVMWSMLLMTSAISRPLWSSVYECQGVECAFTSLVRTECGTSRTYIDVCYCDMFSVVNVYLNHLKFYVVCINSLRYVCCSECYVVSNVCNESTSCLVKPIGTNGGEVTWFPEL